MRPWPTSEEYLRGPNPAGLWWALAHGRIRTTGVFLRDCAVLPKRNEGTHLILPHRGHRGGGGGLTHPTLDSVAQAQCSVWLFQDEG